MLSYSDKLHLCELVLVTLSYHFSKEVVEHFPRLVCFNDISIIELEFLQICALVGENLKDMW